MARLGALKPLRGTESSLANVVLQKGELAFTYPTTGPGTGYGGIKMGNGTSKFSELEWYITPEESWTYDTGTNEAALLHNIEHPELEQIGKIYYIQSYMNGGTKHNAGVPPTIQQNIPYKVIGINHDGATNTVDLQAMVAVNYIVWTYTSRDNWEYGKYSTSNLYSWVGTSCYYGYSTNIRAKMINMTERWREATGNATSTLRTRSTKCKLLNPVELFGRSAAAKYYQSWQYADRSDHKTKFLYGYGTQYSIWSKSTGADAGRVRYHDTAMSDTCYCWTNSWFAFDLSINQAQCFYVDNDGACDYDDVYCNYGVAPVIRLSYS